MKIKMLLFAVTVIVALAIKAKAPSETSYLDGIVGDDGTDQADVAFLE